MLLTLFRNDKYFYRFVEKNWLDVYWIYRRKFGSVEVLWISLNHSNESTIVVVSEPGEEKASARGGNTQQYKKIDPLIQQHDLQCTVIATAHSPK